MPVCTPWDDSVSLLFIFRFIIRFPQNDDLHSAMALIAFDADINGFNTSNQTPFDMANEKNSFPISDLLTNIGGVGGLQILEEVQLVGSQAVDYRSEGSTAIGEGKEEEASDSPLLDPRVMHMEESFVVIKKSFQDPKVEQKDTDGGGRVRAEGGGSEERAKAEGGGGGDGDFEGEEDADKMPSIPEAGRYTIKIRYTWSLTELYLLVLN